MERIIKEEDVLTVAKKRMPSDINSGDIIHFDYLHKDIPQTSFMARVVGCPGDKVKIEKGVVWVNGKMFTDVLIPTEFATSESIEEMIIPRDTYFILCDNRRKGTKIDSRGIGPLGLWAINGRTK